MQFDSTAAADLLQFNFVAQIRAQATEDQKKNKHNPDFSTPGRPARAALVFWFATHPGRNFAPFPIYGNNSCCEQSILAPPSSTIAPTSTGLSLRIRALCHISGNRQRSFRFLPSFFPFRHQPWVVVPSAQSNLSKKKTIRSQPTPTRILTFFLLRNYKTKKTTKVVPYTLSRVMLCAEQRKTVNSRRHALALPASIKQQTPPKLLPKHQQNSYEYKPYFTFLCSCK